MGSPEQSLTSSVEVIKSSDLSLELNLRGALLERLQTADGVDLLVPSHLNDVGKQRGGVPVCLPIFGSGARLFGLNQHGFGRELMWQKQEIGSEAGALRLTLDAPRLQDPNIPTEYDDLAAELFVSLGKKGPFSALSYVLTLKNSGSTDAMSVAPGFHPYFPLLDGEWPVTFSYGRGSLPLTDKPTTGIIGTHPLNPADVGEAKIFHSTPHDSQTYSWAKFESGARTVVVGADMDTRFVVWSDSGKYICVEPTMSATPTNDLEAQNLPRLKPGKDITYAAQIFFGPAKE